MLRVAHNEDIQFLQVGGDSRDQLQEISGRGAFLEAYMDYRTYRPDSETEVF
jgi:hypothetical protein